MLGAGRSASSQHQMRWGEQSVSSDPKRAGALVRAFLSGDQRALHELVDILRPVLLRQAYTVLRDEGAAEDVFVETMSEMLTRFDGLRDPAAIIDYARRTARSRAVDTLRRRAYRDSRFALQATEDLAAREPDRRTTPVERLGRSTSPEVLALRNEREERVRQVVEQFSEPSRTLISDVLMEGDAVAVVARKLGLSESTARRTLRQARAVLAARLAGYEGRMTGGAA